MTNRRNFIKQAAALGIGSIAASTDLLSSTKFGRPKEVTLKIACWCNLNPDFSGSDDQIKRQIDNVVNGGIDILYPFFSNSEDNLTRLLILAEERGIHVEPVVVPICESGLSLEEKKRRSYQSLKPGGHQFDGTRLCASWRENRECGINRIQGITANYRVNGIHLDGIRYMDTGQSLLWPCHCETCQITYKHLIGKDTLTAEDLKVPGILQKFLNFRGENIRGLVEQASDIVKKAGLPLSMAVRANYFENALVEGQDWVQWTRDGLVDIICPMNYSTEREVHRSKLSMQMQLIGKTVPVYDGIGRSSSAGVITAAQMVQQAEDALELGASGISIFKFNAMGEDDFRELGAFKRANG